MRYTPTYTDLLEYNRIYVEDVTTIFESGISGDGFCCELCFGLDRREPPVREVNEPNVRN